MNSTTITPMLAIGDKVTIRNNFIYDLVNERHYPERIDNYYKLGIGTIVGIYYDLVNHKTFYAVCPDGKDSLEPGVHQYFYEDDIFEVQSLKKEDKYNEISQNENLTPKTDEEETITIPKPKFKVGDKLKRICSEDWKIYVWRAQYDLSEKVWKYYESYDDYYEESELELVEAAK